MCVGRQVACVPFGVAGFSVFDQIERFYGAKRGQQLSALIISQVVGQAAHKHTLIGIYHLQQYNVLDTTVILSSDLLLYFYYSSE